MVVVVLIEMAPEGSNKDFEVIVFGKSVVESVVMIFGDDKIRCRIILCCIAPLADLAGLEESGFCLSGVCMVGDKYPVPNGVICDM